MLKEMLHYRWRKTGCIYVHQGYRYLEFMLFAGLHFANLSQDIEFYRCNDIGIITILPQFYRGSGEKVNLIIKLLEYRFDIDKKNWLRIIRFAGLVSRINRKKETTNSKYNLFSIILEIDLEFVWCEILIVYW